MVFRELQKGITRRLTTLKNATSTVRRIRSIITALYPERGIPGRILKIVHEPGKKRVSLYVDKRGKTRIEKDREMIRAALRREGLDIRTVVIEGH